MPLPEAARPFAERAAEYDAWFDTAPVLFDIELAALRATQIPLPTPFVEIGVGPGRFGKALGIAFGLDPAITPLHMARQRSIIPINGIGEQLPIRNASAGTVFMLFTLCFLAEPAAAAREMHRILKPGGYGVVGFIPAGSAWGKRLAGKGESGHPYYRHARFRSVREIKTLFTDAGFSIREAWSTLFQTPTEELIPERPRPGLSEEAGFCVLITNNRGGDGENASSCQPDHPDN